MSESYIPLYRKYRPQKFDELIGQEIVVKTLSNAINLNKVAHAYLFTGSRGTGKTSTARILAKSLNCIEGPTVNPCGKCPSCVDTANSNSADVIEIDAASNGNVEDARNLIDKVRFMPMAGKYKVYIIDEVHMLSTAAFNTLLKTLEEPPKNLVFILATTESHKVLTTIISRCQRFDFKRVNQELIFVALKNIANKESIKINDKAVSVISRRCNGGMRDALGMLDQISVLSSLGDEITESDIISLLGSMPEDILYNMAESIANKDPGTVLKLINQISLTNEPVRIVRELTSYFRDLLFVKVSDNPASIKDLVNLSESILPSVKAQSEKFETNEIVQIAEKLAECERTLKFSSQQLLLLETELAGICYREDILIIKEFESRIAKLEEALYSGNMPVKTPVKIPPAVPKETPRPEPVAVAATNPIKQEIKEEPVSPVTKRVADENPVAIQPEVTPQEEPKKEAAAVSSSNLADNWKMILDNLDDAVKPLFSGFAKPVEVGPEKIIITIKNANWLKKIKEDKEKNLKIIKAAEKVFGVMPELVVRAPSFEDSSVQKKNDKSFGEIKEAKSVPEKAQQITSSIIDEVPKIREPQVIIDENPLSDTEKEIAEELDNITPEIKPVNLSEQAKLVTDLFNGKVIES